MSSAEKNPLKLTTLSPETTLYEGNIKSVSCHNQKGQFDVLYEHTNFMSMIDEKIVVVLPDNTRREFPVEQALIHVQENEISILVNIAMTQKASRLKNIIEHMKGNKDKKKKNLATDTAAESSTPEVEQASTSQTTQS